MPNKSFENYFLILILVKFDDENAKDCGEQEDILNDYSYPSCKRAK